ncbi:MAG: hypothetical protein CM1200mP41_32640 [Gammaproteobacteria bacterium]|nr:MAG: hypothetical protein CM1200mP41_32640 [Gammaproteobacteria bacterium]
MDDYYRACFGVWDKREFDACGVDFHRRGKIMDESLEILERLWKRKKPRLSIYLTTAQRSDVS